MADICCKCHKHEPQYCTECWGEGTGIRADLTTVMADYQDMGRELRDVLAERDRLRAEVERLTSIATCTGCGTVGDEPMVCDHEDACMERLLARKEQAR